MHAAPTILPPPTARRGRHLLALAAGLALCAGRPAPGNARHVDRWPPEVRTESKPSVQVGPAELLGEVRLPSGNRVLGTPFGGLSGLTYDADRDTYYAVSDDRSERAAARYYGLTIDLTDGRLREGDIRFTQVLTLTDQAGQPFPAGSIDPEGIGLGPWGSLYLSSEGAASASPPHPPWVAEFSLAGRWQAAAPVPDHFLPAPGRGVRNNLAFESLTISPAGTRLVTATERALVQDGPVLSAAGSPTRLLAWALPGPEVVGEYVYPVDADKGLAELLALDEGRTYLALERANASGAGFTARLFEASTATATDVAGLPALQDPVSGQPLPFVPMTKRLVADIGALGVVPDNLEGMTFGPSLPDGRRVLLVVSDDNFSASQTTQLVALAVRLQHDQGSTSRCFLPVASR